MALKLPFDRLEPLIRAHLCDEDDKTRDIQQRLRAARQRGYDNLRAAVVRILVGGARTLTPRFTALASHYLLGWYYGRFPIS